MAARSSGMDLNDQQPVMVFKSLNDRHDKQFLSQSAHFQKVSILSVVHVLIWVKNYCKANGRVELINNVPAICLCATFITGLPMGKPSRGLHLVCLFYLFYYFYFLFFIIIIFFLVGKSLACHSPGKWCLCV